MPPKSRTSPRVAVIIEASNAYGRGLLEGIHRHLREHEPWTILLPEHGRGTPPLAWLRRWRGEGVIARVETPAIARILGRLRRSLGIPVIDVSAARFLPDIPYVETDDVAIAALATQHFLERGFRSFAFLGDRRFRWSDNRCRAFESAVASRGLSLEVFDGPTGRGGRGAVRARRETEGEPIDDTGRIEAWLASLPKPVAVFACYDNRGRQALEACRRVPLAVPDDVAVLGVDDDRVLCELSSPPLSSVVPDAIGAGRLAARLLESLMAGSRLDRDEWLLPPLGLSARQSTDVLAIDDPLVAAAVRFIRDNACSGIKVADVAGRLRVSRRVLESRFARRLGRTPHDEIGRVQFRRVEQLLLETDLSLAAIARRAGFRHAEYMTVAFARRHGVPPSVWRKDRG